MSTLFPGVAQVTILSPDGNTGIIWCSGRNYIETVNGGFVFSSGWNRL
ncbi:MAG: hypothetical protein Q4G69_07050 [Planctomycetia bacterium]|nr:hypothetical protein [Planctomycetia bacterium]